ERRVAAGARADLEVQHRRRDLALAVIADGAVRRVLVRAIRLDPRVERRLLERQDVPPGGRVEVRDLAGDGLEILRRAAQLRRAERAPVVVAGGPFEPPEEARVALFLVAIRRQRGGPNALHVPRVEELVGEEGEQIEVRVARRERRGGGEERRRRRVL